MKGQIYTSESSNKNFKLAYVLWDNHNRLDTICDWKLEDCLIPDLKEFVKWFFLQSRKDLCEEVVSNSTLGFLFNLRYFYLTEIGWTRKYVHGREHPICERIKCKHRSFEKYHCLQTTFLVFLVNYVRFWMLKTI